jgi:thiol-disulfide isomerase/thioredoxin
MTPKSLAALLEEGFQHCCAMDATLGAQLEAFADIVRTLDSNFAETVDRLVLRLRNNGAGSAAPRVGDPMPPFLLPGDEGHLIALEELLSEGPVAVTFHRGHWCPYCRMNTLALAKAQKESRHDGLPMSAFAVAVRGKADMPSCTAHVCL